MGTNYYIEKKPCESCGHHPEEIHLGKSSAGWQFSFQYNGGEYYKNVPEMREWTKGKVIVNEYRDQITYDAFWKMVDAKQIPENQNHAEWCKEHYQFHETEHVIDGYSFSDCPFS